MSQYSVLHVYFLYIYVTGSAKRALNTFYYILQCTAKRVIMACVSDLSFFLHHWIAMSFSETSFSLRTI